MEGKQESQENSKKDFIFMVSIALILFVVTFIVSETTFTKNTIEDIEDNTGINITEPNTEQNEWNSGEEQDNESDNTEGAIELTKENLEEYKKIIDFFNENFSTEYPLKTENLTNPEILHSAMKEVWLKGKKGSEFSATELHNMITKMFGADLKYTNQDIFCEVDDRVIFKYNDGKYQYYGEHGHDGCFMVSRNYFIETKTIDNILEIKTKNIYHGIICGTYALDSFYKDALSQQILYNQSDRDTEDWLGFDEVYELKKDEIPITTYIFQKDTQGNYALKEIIVE